jgi:cytochrome c5
MSDHSHDQHEAHTGPVKTPKQMLLLSLASFIIPVFIIIGLVFYVTSANKTAPGSSDSEKSLAQRIQKVGTVEIRDANRPLKAGEEVYKAQCLACHAAGAAGAPKFADVAAWSPRIKQGLETLVNSSLKGKGAMGAQAGGEFNDIEIARAVVYMANNAGAKFDEPAAPAAPADQDKK